MTKSVRYNLLMGLALTMYALAANFFVLQPTFLIYHTPNSVWAACFAVLATAWIVALNVGRKAGALRVLLATSAGFLIFIAVGAAEPYVQGAGSIQLPILYFGLALSLIPLLVDSLRES